MPPRARALPPTERRAAIVGSALELIREHGAVPSTKEIAEASGIAEGTIFRVFDTKDELIHEVIAVTFCTAPLTRQLQEVDHELPLRDRLVAMVSILQRRFSDVFDLMVGLRLSAPPLGRLNDHHACTPEAGHVPNESTSDTDPCRRPFEPGELDHGPAVEAVISLIQPDADLLTCSARDLARYIRLLTFSGSHRHITDGKLLTPESIVDIVLNGALDPRPAARRRAAGIRTSRPTGSTRTRKAH